MVTDQIEGILTASSEREFAILVVTAALSGVFTFVLALRMLTRDKDIIVRLIDWKDGPEEQEEKED